MVGTIIKKIFMLLCIFFGVTLLAFFLTQLSPIDPAEAYIRRTVTNPTQEQIENTQREMGLDKPIHEQYINWLLGCLRGDFGKSLYTRNSVGADLSKRLPVTLSVVGLSMLWAILLTIPISVHCVRRKGGLFDQIIRSVTIIGISVPGFWLAFLFLLLFAGSFSWFKVVDPDSFRGLILPSLTVAIPVAATMIRMLRAGLLSEMNQDYIFYARARGFSWSRLLWRHALPNALPPVVTLFSQFLGAMIAGSAVVESIFSLKGMGSYLLNAILAYDFTAINGCVVVIAVIFVLCTLISDAVNTRLSPRTAAGGEHG